jgi:hypothetical protein
MIGQAKTFRLGPTTLNWLSDGSDSKTDVLGTAAAPKAAAPLSWTLVIWILIWPRRFSMVISGSVGVVQPWAAKARETMATVSERVLTCERCNVSSLGTRPHGRRTAARNGASPSAIAWRAP